MRSRCSERADVVDSWLVSHRCRVTNAEVLNPVDEADTEALGPEAGCRDVHSLRRMHLHSDKPWACTACAAHIEASSRCCNRLTCDDTCAALDATLLLPMAPV